MPGHVSHVFEKLDSPGLADLDESSGSGAIITTRAVRSYHCVCIESSHWINAGRMTPEHFAWQQGFSSFTVSPTGVSRVRRYIERQEEHHRRQTVDEEIETLVRLNGTDEEEGSGRATG
jgi:hypothetical protein